MAIGRISGSVLKSNLTRNGTDLAFETNLLYLDVTNSRVGIGTSEPSTALHVNGTVTATSFTGDGSNLTNVPATLGDLTAVGSTISSPSNADLTLDPSGSGNISVASNKIIDLAAPGADTDASTKKYVDDSIASVSTTSIAQLNTNVAVTDTGSDGTITVTADGNTELTINDTTAAFSGNVTVAGTTDLSGATTITANTTGDALLITTTEASSTAAPVITLKRNSSSPADADYLGQIKFKGENDADQEIVYAKITGKILDASDGTEDGIIEIAHQKAGSNVITARLRSDSYQLLNGTTLTVDGQITGNLTGNVTGNVSGSSGSTTGNAATATALATARAIGGVNFDGSAAINLPGVNTSGNQDTSGNADTATALATARNIAGQSFDGTSAITIASTDLSNTSAIALLTASQTLTNKTLTSPVIADITSTADIDLTATNDVNIPANVGLTFGDDGEKIEGNGTNLTINSSGDVIIKLTGEQLILHDGTSNIGQFDLTSNNLTVEVLGNDKDMLFKGWTGASQFTALTLDMSAAGAATFNAGVTATTFSGSGASLTSLNGSNISSGTIAAARVATLNQDTSGNAATATALETARNIGGVSFDGSGNINLPGVNTSGNQNTSGNADTATTATNVTASANNSTSETVYLTFVDGATGTQGIETDTGLNYNPSTGVLTTTSVTGNLTGNVTGNVSGSSGSTTGNAATATALATARNIAGQSFDGTSAITIASTDLSNTSSITLNTSSQTLTNKTLTSPQINTQIDVLAQGQVRLQDTSGGQYVALRAPGTVTSNTILTLPDGAGTSGQVLSTNGSGTLSWADGGGGGSGSSYPNSTISTLPSSEGDYDLAKNAAQDTAETPFEAGGTDAFGVNLGTVFDMMDPIGATESTDLGSGEAYVGA